MILQLKKKTLSRKLNPLNRSFVSFARTGSSFPLLYYYFFSNFITHSCCVISPGTHYVKSVRIRSYSGPYFLAFGLNTERYSVSFRIQSKYGKIQTRITPNTDTFHVVTSSTISFKKCNNKCN